MCAACVAQGVTYVGGAVGALQVMRARAHRRRIARQAADGRGASAPAPQSAAEPDPSEDDRVPATTPS